MSELQIRPIEGLQEIQPGAELGCLIAEAAQPRSEEIVVVSQKVVSKAEGRLRRLTEVEAGDRAVELAAELGKDPRMVQLVLDESAEVLRVSHGVLIVVTHHGWVCANAGIDSSNVGASGDAAATPGDDEVVSLLPEDPDRSAREIRASFQRETGASPGVLVADSFGRAWRLGQADVAIGCAGVQVVEDWRGRADADGRQLHATEIAIADQLCSAADLVRTKDSGVPGAVISGAERFISAADGPGAKAIMRPRELDLFR